MPENELKPAVPASTDQKPNAASAPESINPQGSDNRRKYLTIPNGLSIVRLILVYFIASSYLNGHPYHAFILLVISGATDIIDGIIARKFNMVTDLGKVLDPFADKLTQGVVIICLLCRYPHTMLTPLCVLILREAINLTTGGLVFKRTGKVLGAEWHGKVATIIIWLMIVSNIIFPDMPEGVRGALSSASTMMMLISLVLYTLRNMNMIHNAGK